MDKEDRLNELIASTSFNCTDVELQEMLIRGILFRTKTDKYIDIKGNTKNINIIKSTSHNMNINLSNLISNCITLSKDTNKYKIFCMSKTTYESYKSKDMIYMKNKNEFINLVKGTEPWLIYKI